MYCLYQNRISSQFLSEDGSRQQDDEAMDEQLRHLSEKKVVQQLYKNDNITREVSLFFIKTYRDVHFIWTSEMQAQCLQSASILEY
jgi:hypothetical protein